MGHPAHAREAQTALKEMVGEVITSLGPSNADGSFGPLSRVLKDLRLFIGFTVNTKESQETTYREFIFLF